VETARLVGLESSFASIFTEFAAEAIDILSQPTHSVYGKLNWFLQKSPTWNISKFFSYWLERILLRAPEDNDGQRHEMNWLLNLLAQGMQNRQVPMAHILTVQKLMQTVGYGALSKEQCSRPPTILIPVDLVLRDKSQANSRACRPHHHGRGWHDTVYPGWSGEFLCYRAGRWQASGSRQGA
jgi:Nucleolar pre-ribosomal-associated protein 1